MNRAPGHALSLNFYDTTFTTELLYQSSYKGLPQVIKAEMFSKIGSRHNNSLSLGTHYC